MPLEETSFASSEFKIEFTDIDGVWLPRVNGIEESPVIASRTVNRLDGSTYTIYLFNRNLYDTLPLAKQAATKYFKEAV